MDEKYPPYNAESSFGLIRVKAYACDFQIDLLYVIRRIAPRLHYLGTALTSEDLHINHLRRCGSIKKTKGLSMYILFKSCSQKQWPMSKMH